MADGVEVHITDATVISALNTPGGAVADWRNITEYRVLQQAFHTSPVNNPMNALHRGGMVGEFKASWVTRRWGNGHRVGFAIENFSDHALYAEEGRRPSWKWETFSWVQHRPPGAVETHPEGTAGYPAHHTLRDAVNTIGASTGDWSPLT